MNFNVSSCIFLVFLTLNSSVSHAQLCPPSGCDPNSWTIVRDQAEESIINAEINSSGGQMFLYAARDFVANSTQLGYMSSQMYNHWDEISFSIPMVMNYKSLYTNGLELKMTELMYPSGTMEDSSFLSAGMYNALKNIINHHLSVSTNAEFVSLLQHANSVIEDINGKTVQQVRDAYFQCAQPDWC